MEQSTDAKAKELVPLAISVRTKELKPLLEKWRQRNPKIPWKHLLLDALRTELRPLAGKRHAHLVEAA